MSPIPTCPHCGAQQGSYDCVLAHQGRPVRASKYRTVLVLTTESPRAVPSVVRADQLTVRPYYNPRRVV